MPALVQSATQVSVAGSSSDAPSIVLNGTTGGNALVADATIFDLNNTWALDSTTDGGNTFTTRPGVASAVGARTRAVVSHAVNITGGNRTVAFNLSGTSGAGGRYYELGCQEFSGVAASAAEDVFDANEEIDLTSTDISAGPVTTTDAGDLIVGAAATINLAIALGFASPTSWTNSYRQNAGATNPGHDSGYWIPGSIQTTYTAQWSHNNGAGGVGAGVVVALKPAIVGAQNQLAWITA